MPGNTISIKRVCKNVINMIHNGTRYIGEYTDSEIEEMQSWNDFMTIEWLEREKQRGRMEKIDYTQRNDAQDPGLGV